jgi:16S rRNA (guanine1516-N2)-methyltransferase
LGIARRFRGRIVARELIVDFVGGAVGHRYRFGGGRGQALPRAAGFANGRTPSVVDAPAGLGRDAFLLAALGAEVVMIERSPAIAALLEAGLARARDAGPDYAAIAGRLRLIHGDARHILPQLDADVVLVDPMHPPRGNSALVKQEMRLLRETVGDDPDAGELIAAALAAAGQRVVLKWPIHAPLLPGLPPPSHSIAGKSTRYDVFMTHRR